MQWAILESHSTTSIIPIEPFGCAQEGCINQLVANSDFISATDHWSLRNL
jgi:hypothetical protein